LFFRLISRIFGMVEFMPCIPPAISSMAFIMPTVSVSRVFPSSPIFSLPACIFAERVFTSSVIS
jgi:hypothetical protein